MRQDGLLGTIARQDWLEPAEESFQRAVAASFDAGGEVGQKVADFFHGTWLGHPLHVVLTDIPLGAWTAAVALDAAETASPDARLRYAADACVGIGLIGAAGAAVTGLTDWHEIDPPARRVGLVHGLLNLGAAALFTASWMARRSGARTAGKTLALFGIGVGALSAWLGGSLVYDEKIGVDHTSEVGFPDDFKAVLPESELNEGGHARAELEGNPILLVRRDGRVFAMAETCSHLGGPLSEGKIDAESVQCPWHGSRFSLVDGRVLNGPAVHPQPCLEARIQNGQIEVRRHKPGQAAMSDLGSGPVPTGPEPPQSSVQPVTEIRRPA